MTEDKKKIPGEVLLTEASLEGMYVDKVALVAHPSKKFHLEVSAWFRTNVGMEFVKTLSLEAGDFANPEAIENFRLAVGASVLKKLGLTEEATDEPVLPVNGILDI